MTVPIPSESERSTTTTIGRYVLHAPIARGGMATIHLARLMGAEGFSRVVAVKRLHPEFVANAEFLTMFLDEARIASKVQHPNVVHVIDVIASGAEVLLVQEYVHGVPLNVLLKAAHHARAAIPLPIAVAIASGVAAGVHGAHVATDELGAPLNIVHRDVSPQNVMLSLDGTPRLLDFGVAKATLSSHVTRVGTFKGKIGYMAPEQLRGNVTQVTDIYSLGVLLWEAIVGRRLHLDQDETAIMTALLLGDIPTVSAALAGEQASMPEERWNQVVALSAIVAKAMAREPGDRFRTAAEFGAALTAAVPPAPAADVGAWVKEFGHDFLDGRDKLLVHEEVSWRKLQSGPSSLSVASGEISAPGIAPTSVRSRSGVSSVPRASASAEAKPRDRRGVWLALGLLFVGLAAGIALSRRHSEPPTTAVLQPAPLPPTPTAATPAPLPPPSSSPVATTSAPPVSAPTLVRGSVADEPRGAAAPASPSPRYYPRPRAAAPAIPPTTNRPAQAPTATSSTAPDCDPPFYFEGNKKLYKPGCI